MTSRGFHLSTIILTLSFGAVFLIAVIFGMASFQTSQTFISHQINENFQYRHRIVQLTLKEQLGRAASLLISQAGEPDLLENLQQKNRAGIEDNLFSLLQFEETQELDFLVIVDDRNRVVGNVSSPLSELNQYSDQLVKLSEETIEQWRVAVVNGGENETVSLLFSVPIVGDELGRVLGRVIAGVSVSGNRNFADFLRNAAGVEHLFITYHGRAIVNATELDSSFFIEKFKQQSENDIAYVGAQVASKIALGVPGLHNRDLQAVMVLNDSNFAELNNIYFKGLILLIVGALVTAGAITLLMRAIMKKSRARLLDYVDNVTQGDRDAQYHLGAVAEFNHLGDAVGQMVETIRDNERYLTNLIERASSPILAWDNQGRITRLNKSAETLFDRSWEQVKGSFIDDLLPEISHKDNGVSLLDRTKLGETVNAWETSQINNLHSKEQFISWSFAPVGFDEEGNVTTILAQGNDITPRRLAERELQHINDELEQRVLHRTRALEEEIIERRNIEDELRRSEERFRDIAEAASDWFWEMGPDYRFTYMSEKAFLTSGMTREQVIGKTRFELVASQRSEDEADKWREHEELLRRHEPFQGFEYHFCDVKGRERVFRVSGRPIFDAQTKEFLGYRGAGRDVTQVHLRHLELVKAREGAEQANRAKSEFLSSMSHELRTPLNGILGFSQLLLMPGANDVTDKQREFIDQIIRAGQHLLELINEILDLSKIEAGKIQVSREGVKPSEVMRDVMDLLGNTAQDYKIKLKNDIAAQDDENMVYADFTRLKQILMNLGSNGIKYNRAGGEVVFSCRHLADECKIEFAVEDTGHGIREEDLQELFKPFSRLDAEFSEVEGTGIGLTITRQLVILMDGEIGVESTKGEGSRFWFTLPVYAQASQVARESDKTFAIGSLDGLSGTAGKTILYVEDNPNNRVLLEEAFDGIDGIKLHCEVSGEAGLAWAEAHKPDLILLDINLPGLSGWEIIQRLKKIPGVDETPVIAVTAQAMVHDIEKGKELGFDEYLSKPLDIAKVFETIGKYLNDSTLVRKVH